MDGLVTLSIILSCIVAGIACLSNLTTQHDIDKMRKENKEEEK